MITRSTRGSASANRGTAGQTVICLDLDHRPYRDTHRPQRGLQQVELRQQQRVHSGARLVAGPHVVAEGLDDVIGSDAKMRRAVLKHREDRLHHTTRCADLHTVGVQMTWPRRVVLPKDLIRPVDEMNHHLESLAQRTTLAGASPDETAAACAR
jgi:hypothetical protein